MGEVKATRRPAGLRPGACLMCCEFARAAFCRGLATLPKPGCICCASIGAVPLITAAHAQDECLRGPIWVVLPMCRPLLARRFVAMSGGRPTRRTDMPRYVVQRTFPEGLHIPVENGGADLCRGVIERNADEGVTWISSYVSDDKTRTFCIYDAPTPEAIRKTAARNELPVDRITRVSVLDPYFYS